MKKVRWVFPSGGAAHEHVLNKVQRCAQLEALAKELPDR